MADHSTQPVLLTTVLNEAEAAVLLAALDARGIEAEMVGGLTSGFKAEAPGNVSILVAQNRLEEARRALAEIEAEAREHEAEAESEAEEE